MDSNGNLFVTEYTRVVEFNKNGNFVRNFGGAFSDVGPLTDPSAVAVDGSGNVFVADDSTHRVVEFNSAGGFLQTIGSFGFGNGQFRGLDGIALDNSGNLFVTDYANWRIVKFDAVPEPGSVALLVGMATVGAGVLRRRRK